MDPKMTGEPNQEQSVHPSVFRFDPYPPTQQIVWNQTDPFTNSQFSQSPSHSLFQHISVPQSSAHFSPFGGSPFPIQTNVLGHAAQAMNSNLVQGFSFGSPQQNEGVVHFPFQISQINHGLEHKTIRCKRKTDSPP